MIYDFQHFHYHPFGDEISIIPSATDFLKGNDKNAPWTGTTEEAMVEFAKLHVKAALESAYNNHEIIRSKVKLDTYDYADSSHYTVDKNSIIRAYPESNIKE